MHIPFTKLQGLGNHFVLVHATDVQGLDPGRLAIAMSRHHFGVGADGLLLVSASGVADVRMQYFDPEGLEDMCGNGLRCVAHWAHARGLAPSRMTVETLSGVRECEVLSSGEVQAEMGEPILATQRLPAVAPVEQLLDYPVEVNGRTYPVTGVSFGTTHVVIVGHGREGPHWAEDSAALEVHPMFPDETTVDWVEVVSPDHILMRPWERRLGETLACGTGACASAVATALHGLTERRVRVQMKGGSLLVHWREDNRVIATGAADIVFTGRWKRGQEPLPRTSAGTVPAPVSTRPRSEPIRALNRIRIEETGEPLVEIIHRRRGLFVCCDRRIWARATVVEMLARAQESLPAGLHLFVIEGYRSLARQRVLYERFWAQSLAEHPEWPLSVRRRMVNRMIAPTDVTCPPGHCTGGALDVSLVTADGREIDMISPCEGRLSCPTTFYDGLTPEALANRRLLCETLEAQGFRNYPYEWWHYSYGDSGWAFRMNLPACPYGAAPPPPGYSMPTTEPG